MKIYLIILVLFAFIGLLTIGNIFHEGFHYLDLKKHSGVSIKSLRAVAVPIPETNYDRIGFVSYTFNQTEGNPDSSEAKARAYELGIEILILGIFFYFLNKEGIASD